MKSQREVWDQKFREGGFWIENKDLCNHVFEYVGKGGKVLDLGCGSGGDSILMASKGYEVTAVDFSAEAVEMVKQRMEEQGVTLELLQKNMVEGVRGFPDTCFDAVYSHLSLHYFKDATTREIFSQIRRILKPGGYLIFSVKSTGDIKYGEGEKVEKDMFIRKGHVRHFFSESYIKKQMAGFEILKMKLTDKKFSDQSKSTVWDVVARKPEAS